MSKAIFRFSREELFAERIKYRRRNQTAFIFEAFCFSFATTLNSQQTVIPSYVAELSDNAILISLVSVIFYGCTYCAGILSCLIGLNSKSPKWSAITMCGLHRIGFLFLFISTFFAGKNSTLALVVFFAAFASTCTMSGVSSPLFNMLVANTIPDRVGDFFGTYNLSGAISGIIASQVLKKCYEHFAFPLDYRVIFLLAVISAVIASVVLACGIKEVRAPVPELRVHAKELSAFFCEAWRGSGKFRRFVGIRMVMAAAEFSIPFFIVAVASFKGAPVGYVGTASLVLLVTKIAAAKILGRIADRLGEIAVLAISCICGLSASLMVLFTSHYLWIFPIFILVSFVQTGVNVAESVAVISNSDGRNTTIFTATNGLLITPIYILASFAGGILAEKFSMDFIFLLSAINFTIALCFAIYANTVINRE